MNFGDVDHLHYEEYPQVRQHIVLPETAGGVSHAPYGEKEQSTRPPAEMHLKLD